MNIERKNPGQDKEGLVDEAVRVIREVRVPQGPPAEVVESVLAAGNREQSKFEKGRFKMNRLMKIAAAILIVVGIGTVIGLLTQGNGMTSIAWADVGSTLERARTICFTMTVDKGGTIHYSGKTMYTAPGMTRLETADSVTIFDWAKGRFLVLDLKNKTAHGALITEIKNPWQDNWFEELRKVVGNPKADTVGEKVINGQTTKGWRVTSGGEIATVWADAETAEPIRVEFEVEQERIVMSNFEFNKELDESLFSFKVPDDYGLHTMTNMKGSDPSVEDVAGLLRIWAKGNERKFPLSLDTGPWYEAARKVDWRTEKTDAATLNSMIFRAFWFLHAESGWKYMGAEVALGDGDTAIFWHKAKGSEKYKIIYGDLSIKELAEVDLPR